MQDDKPDRRVQRTRQLLQQALAELIEEKGYDAVTIEDITERANLGRTTFYLHFRSKEDLFLSSHMQGMLDYRFGIYSREELLADDPPARMAAVFEYLKMDRSTFGIMRHGKDAPIIMRAIHDIVARNLQESLEAAFDESQSSIPFSALANYIVGSQLAFMTWWIERHMKYTPQEMAHMFHRLQRAAVRDAMEIQG